MANSSSFKWIAVLVIAAVSCSQAFSQMIAFDDIGLVNEDEQVVIDVQLNDLNLGGGLTTTSFFSFPPNGTIELLDVDSFRYIPNLNYNGIDTFSYRVCNGEEPIPSCDYGLVIVTILPVPDYPVASIDFVNTSAETATVIDVQGNDLNFDSENLTTEILLDPAHGTSIVLGFDSLLYTPEAFYIGSDSIEYRVCKTGSSVYCDTAKVYITVLQTNFNAPVAVDDYYMVEVGTENLFDVLSNDSDADGDELLLESIFFSSLLGTVEVSEDSLLYLALQPTIDTIYYIVCDDNAPSLCDTGMVVVEVLDIQVPDSFSPNGDGWNELFQIQGLEAYPGFELSIYNRWGKRIFSTISADFSWRGEVTEGDPLPSGEAVDGTYFYVLQLNNGFPPLSGTIVLKR